jgi:hypothetical protein
LDPPRFFIGFHLGCEITDSAVAAFAKVEPAKPCTFGYPAHRGTRTPPPLSKILGRKISGGVDMGNWPHAGA